MTSTLILYCDSVRFLPPRAATKRAMPGGRRDLTELNFSIAPKRDPKVSSALSKWTWARLEASIARSEQVPPRRTLWTALNQNDSRIYRSN